MRSLVFVVGGLLIAVGLAGLGVLHRGGQPEGTSMTMVKKEAPAYSKAGYDIAPLSKSRVEELARHLYGLTTQTGLKGNMERDRLFATELVSWWVDRSGAI